MLVACKEQMTAILLPPPLLRMVLKIKLTWKLVVDYLKHFNKFNSSFLRIKFLKKCLDNDIIPDFLRIRVSDNGVFSDQAVQSFQLRLLKSELNQANADRAKASGNVVKAREVVRRGIDEKWWPSVIFYLNRQARCSVNNLMGRHKRKLEKLSERQNRPLKNLVERAVRILDEVILPLWVREVLNFGTKHPVRDKFNEIHFVADIDSFLYELKLIEYLEKNYVRLKQLQRDMLRM